MDLSGQEKKSREHLLKDTTSNKKEGIKVTIEGEKNLTVTGRVPSVQKQGGCVVQISGSKQTILRL